MQEKVYNITLPISIDGTSKVLQRKVKATSSVTEAYFKLKAYIEVLLDKLEIPEEI